MTPAPQNASTRLSVSAPGRTEWGWRGDTGFVHGPVSEEIARARVASFPEHRTLVSRHIIETPWEDRG